MSTDLKDPGIDSERDADSGNTSRILADELKTITQEPTGQLKKVALERILPDKDPDNDKRLRFREFAIRTSIVIMNININNGGRRAMTNNCLIDLGSGHKIAFDTLQKEFKEIQFLEEVIRQSPVIYQANLELQELEDKAEKYRVDHKTKKLPDDLGTRIRMLKLKLLRAEEPLKDFIKEHCQAFNITDLAKLLISYQLAGDNTDPQNVKNNEQAETERIYAEILQGIKGEQAILEILTCEFDPALLDVQSATPEEDLKKVDIKIIDRRPGIEQNGQSPRATSIDVKCKFKPDGVQTNPADMKLQYIGEIELNGLHYTQIEVVINSRAIDDHARIKQEYRLPIWNKLREIIDREEVAFAR